MTALTEEQFRAVARDTSHTCVAACPGSGKTRTIVAKLLRCIEDIREGPRRIACITYTNAAVQEVETRLRAWGRSDDERYYAVSTIHSFCLNAVLRNHCWRLPEFASGFEVAPPESDEHSAAFTETCQAAGVRLGQARDGLELLNRAPDGSPVVPPGGAFTPSMAVDFWRRLQLAGFLDFPSIVYYANRVLAENPSVRAAVASRFAWILVDEFQDTSALQVEVLRHIVSEGCTRLFLVGDPYQSIYAFAGARPDLAAAFTAEIGAAPALPLSGNYRCSSAIVAQAETLLPRTPAMRAVGHNAGYGAVPRYVEAGTTFQAITEQFLPELDARGVPYGRAAVLAPWWTKLFPLGRALRDFGVSVVGPGARPYRRDRSFGRLAEPVCAYVVGQSPGFIPRIERAIYELLLEVTGEQHFGVFSYEGRITAFQLVEAGIRTRARTESGMEWLHESATSFSEVLIGAGMLPAAHRELLSHSVTQMEEDISRSGIDVENFSVSDLGLFAAHEGSLNLLTMHRSKGREFDAVALIDVIEGRVPNFRAQSSHEIAESRRLLYVGITRAERVLMYVTDREDSRNRASRFLGDDGLGLTPERC